MLCKTQNNQLYIAHFIQAHFIFFPLCDRFKCCHSKITPIVTLIVVNWLQIMKTVSNGTQLHWMSTGIDSERPPSIRLLSDIGIVSLDITFGQSDVACHLLVPPPIV